MMKLFAFAAITVMNIPLVVGGHAAGKAGDGFAIRRNGELVLDRHVPIGIGLKFSEF